MHNQDEVTVIPITDLSALRTAIRRIGEALHTMGREDTGELLREILFDAAQRNQNDAMDVLERIDESEPNTVA